MRNRVVRFLCGRLNHPIAKWSMDISGEFAVSDCSLCGTIIFKSMIEGHDKKDYEQLLDRWFSDWRHDEQ